MNKHIPVYARFQWINSALVRRTIGRFFRYAGTGRRGYDKVTLFLWLAYKQLHGCTYRDLESMSGIDHTTFVKFRGRLKRSRGFERIFERLASLVIQSRDTLKLVLDSSFVETYSGHDEAGSAYSGHKEANGYKTHEIIDFETRVPLFQAVTPGAVADIVIGRQLVSRAPPDLPVRSFAADKGYDSESFVYDIHRKWKIRPAIPMRRFAHDGNRTNRALRGAHRSITRAEYCERTEIERQYSRKKGVFNLGEERTRHLENFRANAYFVSGLQILEWLSKNETAAA